MKELDRSTREYVLELITTLKTTRSRIASAEATRDRWAERERLARSRGKEELAGEAAERRRQQEADLERLRTEERELAAEAEEARKEWTRAGIRAQLNVDAERLLASLEQAAGTPDAAEQELEGLELDAELSRMKEELEAGEGAASDDGPPAEEQNQEEEDSP